jgi:CO/xanthine dehydrogenase Mo-binding subunit
MTDITERLRAVFHAPLQQASVAAGTTYTSMTASTVVYRNPDGPEAAAEIERLRDEIAKLQADNDGLMHAIQYPD